MATQLSHGPVEPAEHHWREYFKFLWRALVAATDGSRLYYTWMFALSAVFLVGINAWAQQVAGGMVVTGMSDHVSWGLYIANFTFAVGLAAGGVMMVIPAYLYKDHDMHDVVIVGEILAIASIAIAIGFIMVDIGRPERVWHMMPFVGRLNWPVSILTWDMLVLSGYLIINLHIVGYLLYHRFTGRPVRQRWYIPFVMVSIIWAISIHTVTAFLYSGLGGRPFWNSALLAPRFLTTAFVVGPAFIVVLLYAIRRFSAFPVPEGAVTTLVKIMRVTVVINLFMLLSELFTEFYTGGSHTATAEYLFFGLHGKTALVPWSWASLGLNVVAAVLLLLPSTLKRPKLLIAACAMTFVGIWIEKGMGLTVAGFIPSTLHEVVEYTPSLTEWKVTWGVWAFGLMVLTVALKIAIPVLTGENRLHPGPDQPGPDQPAPDQPAGAAAEATGEHA